jgi:hypothetical protein
MSTKTKVNKKMVALGLSRKTVPQLITDVEHYLASMTANAHFPNPSPALSVIAANLSVVKNDLAVSMTRVRGSVAKLHADVRVLITKLRTLAQYVEGEANLDPDHATDIILSAGMVVKKNTPRPPRVFSVTLGKNHGSVLLNTKGIARGAYLYDMTTDASLAPASWIRIYEGVKVKYVKDSLSPGTRYFFRSATIDKNGLSNYSPVLSVVVQ